MEEVIGLRLSFQDALIKLQFALKRKTSVAPKKELQDFSAALTELFRSPSLFPSDELQAYWLMGFQTLKFCLLKIFVGKIWLGVTTDALLVSTFLFKHLPGSMKVAKISDLMVGLNEVIGHIASVLCSQEVGSPTLMMALNCAEVLVDVVNKETVFFKGFYTLDNVQCVGYLVSSLLGLFESADKDIALRLLAGKVLLKIVDCADFSGTLSLSVILPGTSSRTIKTTFTELHSEILCVAINIFAHLVFSTLNDELFEHILENGEEYRKNALLSKFGVDLTPEWYKETSGHLKGLVDSLCSRFVSHADYKVRLSLLQCVVRLYRFCSKAFGKQLEATFVDTVVLLLLDPYQEISDVASSSLNEFREKSESYLSDRLREKLLSLCTGLRYETVISSDITKMVKEISCMLEGLGKINIDSMFLVGGKPLKRLVSSLAESIRVDVDRLPVHLADPNLFLESSELPLRYSINPSDLKAICSRLADCEQIHILLEQILEYVLSAQPADCIGFVAISTFIFEDLHKKHLLKFSDDLFDICRSFIEQAISCLQSLVIEEPADDRNIKREINENDEFSSLAALQLSLCASAFSCFRSEQLSRQVLVDTLFEILVWTASSNRFCSSAAERTLAVIAKVMGNRDVSSLCVFYGSYLLTRVAVISHGFSRESRAPLALCSLMNHCNDPALFDHLQHMIPQLLSGVDFSYQESVIYVLRSLLCFARAMRRWFKDPILEEKKNNIKKQKVNSDEEVCYEEEKPIRPPFVSATVEILQRTKHLLSSPYLPIQLLVLNILEECILSIRNFYDDLLPMLHQNWAGLLSRLRDKVTSVRLRAFQVIVVMCEVSGSFLCTRFKEEAWVLVRDFMLSQAKISANSTEPYTHSSSYLYQKTVLQSSFRAWKSFGDVEDDAGCVLDLFLLYRDDSKQPIELRQLAKEALAKFEQEK